MQYNNVDISLTYYEQKYLYKRFQLIFLFSQYTMKISDKYPREYLKTLEDGGNKRLCIIVD